MSTAKGFQPATGRWDAFALAAAAPLGPFVHAHLAPKFPPDLLNAALATFLPLQDDELLLAIIESGGPKPVRCCALTTRRVYWTDWVLQAAPRGPKRLPSPFRSRKHQLVVRVADFARLPERMQVVEAADGSSAVDLGKAFMIVVGKGEGALASALARYLETMGSAARAGEVPEGVIDADLASRAARALPDVARVTAGSRTFGQDLSQFRSSLDSATARTFVTLIFVGSCVLIYAAMVARGVPWLFPSAQQLLGWGANNGVGVVVDHEYWRLITNIFLHGGIIHLALNMWNLLIIGPLVERLYGNLAFAAIYLAAGIGGALASLATNPFRVGVGASGAILGILGALVAFLIVHRRAIPKSILKSFVNSFFFVIISMAILGFIPNIDHQAHLGGFAAGFLSGLLLTRPWPVGSSRWVMLRRLAATFLIAGALTALTFVVARRTPATPPAVAAFRHGMIVEQIRPALQEFNDITSTGPGTLILSRDYGDPGARAVHLNTIRALVKRALANLKTLRRATTPDPELRKMLIALVEAQSSQLAGLRAAERFLGTGDAENLKGSGGMIESMTNARKAVQSFQEQQTRFLRANQLLPEDPGS
jgi:rhomboid protease GluP